MPTLRVYKDFTVMLDHYDEATGEYEVSMPPSDEWGATTPIKVRLDLPAIEDSLTKLNDKRIFEKDLIPLGKQLTDRLLPAGSTIRNNFTTAVKNATVDEGVRLRLIIRGSQLARLPWEYAYLPLKEGAEDGRTHFLVVHPKVSIVRNPPMEGKVQDLALADPGQITLAGVMANPEAPGYSNLDLDTERYVVEEVLKDFAVDGIKIVWESFQENATEDDLNKVLLGKPDILHFSGHGRYSDREDQGSILLVEDKSSLTPRYMGAQAFARKVASASVRLAYLGACESSKLQDASAWTGIAQALIAEGVLAVVAMQYEIQDSKAILFSKAFYMALAAGLTVDEAVTTGRLAVLEVSDSKGVEWGVPTLYLRAKDGVLFPVLSERESSTADGIRLAVKQVVNTVEEGGRVIGISFKSGPVAGSFVAEGRFESVKGTVIAAEFVDL